MSIFTEVKEVVSAKDAAFNYGVKVKKNGMCCCPFHDDKHPSMKVDKRYHCFVCGADGDVINFVQNMFGLDALGSAKKLINDFRLNIATEPKKESIKEHLERTRAEQARERKANIEAAFQSWFRETCYIYSEYHQYLYRWKQEYSPVRTVEDIDIRYVEACQQLDFISNRLDDMWFNWTEAEKKEFFLSGREEVKRIEERVREIRAEYGGDAA